MPAVPGFTEEGSVGYSNYKTFGHAQDQIMNAMLTDMLQDQRESRSFMRAVNTRSINKLLDYEIPDAVADGSVGLQGLAQGQVGAKIAQSTPPESGGLAYVIAQLAASVASIQQLVKTAQTTPPDTSK
jgi:hypothetical protein